MGLDQVNQDPNSFRAAWGRWRRMPWTRIQIVLLLALVAVELADLATFFPAISAQGLDGEQNLLARNAYTAMGPLGPVCLKVATTSAILGFYVIFFPRVRAWNVMMVVMICLVAIGPLSNVIAVTDSSRSGNQGEKAVGKIGEAGPFMGSSLSRCDALNILGNEALDNLSCAYPVDSGNHKM
jgi:hypothetical protein